MKNVLKQYFEGKTGLLISEEPLHELPTITICFLPGGRFAVRWPRPDVSSVNLIVVCYQSGFKQ